MSVAEGGSRPLVLILSLRFGGEHLPRVIGDVGRILLTFGHYAITYTSTHVASEIHSYGGYKIEYWFTRRVIATLTVTLNITMLREHTAEKEDTRYYDVIIAATR